MLTMLIWNLLCLLVLSITSSCRDLRIGAFNIQIFGVTKAKNQNVMDILVKIIHRYDLLLIQEIRDSSPDHKAINQLLYQVNKGQSEPFSMVLSERLGRTISKEQYAFLYKAAAGLQVIQKFVYEDTKIQNGVKMDLFERQPFVVSFSSNKTELANFGLIGIHVDPDQAVEEINSIHKYVVDDVKIRLGQANLMILGDLNADCNYVSKTKWKQIQMKTNPKYDWLIGDDQDTTVKGSHCAYDRFITTGPGWTEGIVPGSASVFMFDMETSIGNIGKALAEDVSDHYPIELLLAEKQNGRLYEIQSKLDGSNSPEPVKFVQAISSLSQLRSDRLSPMFMYMMFKMVNQLYIKLTGAYTSSGSLSVSQRYELGVKDNTDDVLKVFDKDQEIVGELNCITVDEIILKELLLEFARDLMNKIKLYIQPIKNRYSGRQRSELYVAVWATDKQIVSIVWNLLSAVCDQTYFKCLKT